MNITDAITHGVYVLGTHTSEQDNLMTAAWLCQISGKPFTILVAVGIMHLTAELIRKSGRFSISTLSASQREIALLCGTCSGVQFNKADAVHALTGKNGCPIIPSAAAYLYCNVSATYESGDHTLFLAEVADGEISATDLLL